MPNLPIFSASEPNTIPAKVYDKIWIEEIVIKAPDPNGDAVGEVKLHKYGVFDGVAELDPHDGKWITIQNLLVESDNDQDLANALSYLLTYIQKLGQSNNIIATE